MYHWCDEVMMDANLSRFDVIPSGEQSYHPGLLIAPCGNRFTYRIAECPQGNRITTQDRKVGYSEFFAVVSLSNRINDPALVGLGAVLQIGPMNSRQTTVSHGREE